MAKRDFSHGCTAQLRDVFTRGFMHDKRWRIPPRCELRVAAFLGLFLFFSVLDLLHPMPMKQRKGVVASFYMTSLYMVGQ